MENLIYKLKQNNIDITVVNNQLKLDIPDDVDATVIIREVKKNKQELISFIKKIKTDAGFRHIKHCEKREHYVLSSAQKRLWFLHEFDKTSQAYNISQVLKFDFILDKQQVSRAFNALIDRHDNLRTSFFVINGEPRQRIALSVDFRFECYRSSPDRVQTIIRKFNRPFDLTTAPLIRAGLIEVMDDNNKDGDKEQVLIVDMHHIITDGISHNILAKDITALYNDEELPPLRLQYKDYSEWQQGDEHQQKINKQKEYWIQVLRGKLPMLKLHTDYPRDIHQPNQGNCCHFEIGKKESDGLKSIGVAQGVTLYMVLLAISNVWLTKLTGQKDIIIGSPTAGRNHSDLESVIGMFVNTIALRNYAEGNNTFNEFLEEVKENALKAFENQDYQFEDLVRVLDITREVGRNPIFNVLLNVVSLGIDEVYEKEPTTKNNPLDRAIYTSKFDITINAKEVRDGISFSIQYRSELFNLSTIEKFSAYFINIIKYIITNPELKIEDMSLLSLEEKTSILRGLKRDLKKDISVECIQNKLRKCFTKYFAKIAIACGDKSYSYSELDQTSNYVAGILLENGIPRGSYIGILCENRYNLLSIVVGILKARCIFVPLNITFPVAKTISLLDQVGISQVFTDLSEESKKKYSEINNKVEFLDINKCAKLHREILSWSQKLPTYQLDDPIYVYFTSGTTGKPKAIMGKNKSLSHFIDWEISAFNIDNNSRLSQLTNPGFDAFLRDVFVTLCTGGTLCIPKDETVLAKTSLPEWIEKNKISIVHCVPSIFRLFNSAGLVQGNFRSLQYILMSGEEIYPSELKKWYETFNIQIQLVNLYGPTETTMIRSFYSIQPADVHRKRIPIGKPINNSQVFILNEALEYCEPLVAGEIYIRTPYRTFGYVAKDANEDSFIKNPFSNDPDDLLYRTGDLGKQLPDGNYEYLGRKDDVVKIRGVQIDLEEINNFIMGYRDISESIVVAKSNHVEEVILCAYFISDKEVEKKQLRRYLTTTLPHHMIPSFLCQLDSIPLNTNGKIDIKALPAPDVREEEVYVAPSGEIEEKLVEIWADLLETEKEVIGVNDSFFAIGGHSLNAITLIHILNEEFDVEISLLDFFSNSTISALAQYIGTDFKLGKEFYV